MEEILLIEPFYAGSHKVLIDILKQALDEDFGAVKVHLASMKGKKWPWRARTSAVHLSQTIPDVHSFRTLFCTSVLNLSELIALRPDLRDVKKIIYFHENQLVYPIREYKDRDFQYGYNEILSCLVADQILFNSNFNMNSFLNNIKKHFDILPDYRPKCIKEKIAPKCQVLYFPMSPMNRSLKNVECLHIVWPHRWEHDKNPEAFLDVVVHLVRKRCKFKLSMIGEQFTDQDTYENIKNEINEHVENWGFIESRENYLEILSQAHISVSTAKHEFFGVSILESAQKGCLPLCPNRLVYPEIYPEICLYNNYDELFNKLVFYSENLCQIESIVKNLNINFDQFSISCLIPKYVELFR